MQKENIHNIETMVLHELEKSNYGVALVHLYNFTEQEREERGNIKRVMNLWRGVLGYIEEYGKHMNLDEAYLHFAQYRKSSYQKSWEEFLKIMAVGIGSSYSSEGLKGGIKWGDKVADYFKRKDIERVKKYLA